MHCYVPFFFFLKGVGGCFFFYSLALAFNNSSALFQNIRNSPHTFVTLLTIIYSKAEFCNFCSSGCILWCFGDTYCFLLYKMLIGYISYPQKLSMCLVWKTLCFSHVFLKTVSIIVLSLDVLWCKGKYYHPLAHMHQPRLRICIVLVIFCSIS